MKAIVTGSHGFIGHNLVEALRARGDVVFEYDTKIGKDLLQQDSNFPHVDVIYHLACVNQMAAESDPLSSRFVNAFTALQMALHAVKCSAKLVYTSTASVYGQAEQIPTPSDAPTDPLSVYARDKLKGEQLVRNSGADWTILRLSNVYGPHQTTENPYCGVIGRFIEQAEAGEPLTVIGDGNQTRDFTYVEDVVEWLLFFGDPGEDKDFPNKRTYNVSHGIEHAIKSVALGVVASTGGIAEHIYIPERSVDKIKRRCLVPDLRCATPLMTGLKYTLEWRRTTTR